MTAVTQFDPFGSEPAYGEPQHSERPPSLIEATSNLIRASELGELGRMTFERVSSPLDAIVCTNYRLDPAAQRLRLVFAHGIPSDRFEAARSLELGQEYCGTAAASCQPLVAVANDPMQTFARSQGCKRRSRNFLLSHDPLWSLRLDPELLDERPPFLDLGLLKGGERLRRLLLARENLEPKIGKPRSRQRIGQCLNGGKEPGGLSLDSSVRVGRRRPKAQANFGHFGSAQTISMCPRLR